MSAEGSTLRGSKRQWQPGSRRYKASKVDVRLTPHLRAELENLCKIEGVSPSAMIRRLIVCAAENLRQGKRPKWLKGDDFWSALNA